MDDISWKSKKNFTLNHALKRIEYYVQEKFRYKIVDVDFNPADDDDDDNNKKNMEAE